MTNNDMSITRTIRSATRIYLLVKIGRLEHLEHLRTTGRLRMQRIASFAALEDDVGRGDCHEGLAAMFRADQSTVTLGGNVLSGLVGSVTIALDDTGQHHISCWHAVTSGRLPAFYDEHAPVVDPENFGLGTHALVITDVTEFISRVTTATERLRINMKAGLVEYVRPTHHGEMGAFVKLDRFAGQVEWRISVEPSAEEIFWFDLGSNLEDISTIVTTDELNSLIEFKKTGT